MDGEYPYGCSAWDEDNSPAARRAREIDAARRRRLYDAQATAAIRRAWLPCAEPTAEQMRRFCDAIGPAIDALGKPR